MPAPLTHVIDQEATFGTVFFMTCTKRKVYAEGPDGKRVPTDDQEIGKATGLPKWQIEATALSQTRDDETQQHGLKVGIEAATNPAEGLNPGTAVIFDQLELGVIARDNGGAQLWYRAAGLRPQTPANGNGTSNGHAKATTAASAASSSASSTSGKGDDS